MTETTHFTDALDDCLDALTRGRLTVVECLAQYPQHRQELAELLPVAQQLQQEEHVTPSSAFRRRCRQRIRHQIRPTTDKSVTFIDRLRYAWQRIVNPQATRRLAMNWIILLAIIVLLFTGGVAVSADNAAPRDSLYGLDRLLESLRLQLARTPAKQVELQLAYAGERLQEAGRLKQQGSDYYYEALANYQEAMAAVAGTVATADADQRPRLARLYNETVADHHTMVAAWNDDDEKNNARQALAAMPIPDDGAIPTNTDDTCTYSQGYWRTHVTQWPVDEITMGGVTYTQAEALAILQTPPHGDVTYILARELIGARLNVLNGADDTAIDIGATDAWLADYPLGSELAGADRANGVALAETLDDYNSGLIGPGSCDEVTPTPMPTIR